MTSWTSWVYTRGMLTQAIPSCSPISLFREPRFLTEINDQGLIFYQNLCMAMKRRSEAIKPSVKASFKSRIAHRIGAQVIWCCPAVT